MDGEHYFTAEPVAADRLRQVRLEVDGRELTALTAPGVFSAHRLDLGTRVLLGEVPVPPPGDLLDLGCGWGAMTMTMALRSPAATVWAVDVNQRALDLVRRNAAANGMTGVRAVLPDQVPDAVRFAALWSNPPIRVGKPALHALLRRWLPRLDAGAAAHLVVQRNLGADSLHRWLDEELAPELRTERAASSKGFRVLRVVRAS